MMIRAVPFLVCLAAVPALAQAPAPAPDVRYLETEAWQGDQMVVVRGAFEVSGPAHRWYGVYFQLRLSADVALRAPGQQGMAKNWADLFTPESPAPARWTDCRAGFTYEEIEAAENLPRGARTELRAVCDLWSQELESYVGSGWSVGARFFVTTDAAGKITAVEFPPGGDDAPAPGAPSLQGIWNLTFPDGVHYGTCAFAEDGHWAWTIYEGAEVQAQSQGTWTLVEDVLTLTHEGGPVEEMKIAWTGEASFTLKKGEIVLTFSR